MSLSRSLRQIVEEINHAERETMDEVGPITNRLHGLIVELCDYFKIENSWNTEPCRCVDSHIVEVKNGVEERKA